MHRMTVTIKQGQALAKSIDLPGLQEALLTAVEAGWDALTIVAEQEADDTYSVVAEEPTGLMVAWMLPPWLAEQIAFPGGEPVHDLHVTLAYLGGVDELAPPDRQRIAGIVGEVVADAETLHGEVGGTGTFPPMEDAEEYPFWVGVNIPGLEELHNRLIRAFTDAGIGVYTHHQFTPHITVMYLPVGEEAPPLDFAPSDVIVDALTVCIGPKRITLPLKYPGDVDVPGYYSPGWRAVAKSAEQAEERYTLGPLYIPDMIDAHGDHTDSVELQKAVWNYVRAKEFDIRLQHNVDIVAGECVEVMVWPYEVTVPMTKADGTAADMTFPAGTPFLGTIWNEWAWELVKSGKLSGYSIGGSADMIEVDLGGDAVAKAKDHGTTAN